MMVVVPPAAAARLPLSKSSAEHRAVGGVLVEMDMGIDAARHGDQAGGVDLLAALVEPLAQRHHPAARMPMSPFTTSEAVAMVVLRITRS